MSVYRGGIWNLHLELLLLNRFDLHLQHLAVLCLCVVSALIGYSNQVVICSIFFPCFSAKQCVPAKPPVAVNCVDRIFFLSFFIGDRCGNSSVGEATATSFGPLLLQQESETN